jgi:hypothetical protein
MVGGQRKSLAKGEAEVSAASGKTNATKVLLAYCLRRQQARICRFGTHGKNISAGAALDGTKMYRQNSR